MDVVSTRGTRLAEAARTKRKKTPTNAYVGRHNGWTPYIAASLRNSATASSATAPATIAITYRGALRTRKRTRGMRTTAVTTRLINASPRRVCGSERVHDLSPARHTGARVSGTLQFLPAAERRGSPATKSVSHRSLRRPVATEENCSAAFRRWCAPPGQDRAVRA